MMREGSENTPNRRACAIRRPVSSNTSRCRASSRVSSSSTRPPKEIPLAIVRTTLNQHRPTALNQRDDTDPTRDIGRRCPGIAVVARHRSAVPREGDGPPKRAARGEVASVGSHPTCARLTVNAYDSPRMTGRQPAGSYGLTAGRHSRPARTGTGASAEGAGLEPDPVANRTPRLSDGWRTSRLHPPHPRQ